MTDIKIIQLHIKIFLDILKVLNILNKFNYHKQNI